jgi:rfaE bifunctional protein nucleotidyltransferase chain/domain
VCDALTGAGVDTGAVVRDPRRPTTAKRRLVAAGQLVARFDQPEPRPLESAVAAAVRRVLADELAAADAVLVGDYGGGVAAAARPVLTATRPATLVVDAHDLGPWASVRPDAVTPSWEEATALVRDGEPHGEERARWVVEHADRLHQACGAELIAVTLDADGSVLLRRGAAAHRTYAVPQPASQTAGAGDAYAATLTAALATAAEPSAAADLAQAAASVSAGRPGTTVCTATELASATSAADTSVVGERELARLVGGYRADGKRIVFTNGCFDVLHHGHVAYLAQARRLGDVLIVALNSDASVARRKGPGRPVNSAADRAAVLAALESVDHVAVFDEDSPRRLLEIVRPQCYVKGGDYTPEMIPEAALVRRLGGRVHVMDYLPEHSTTALIDRIRQDR